MAANDPAIRVAQGSTIVTVARVGKRQEMREPHEAKVELAEIQVGKAAALIPIALTDRIAAPEDDSRQHD